MLLLFVNNNNFGIHKRIEKKELFILLLLFRFGVGTVLPASTTPSIAMVAVPIPVGAGTLAVEAGVVPSSVVVMRQEKGKGKRVRW